MSLDPAIKGVRVPSWRSGVLRSCDGHTVAVVRTGARAQRLVDLLASEGMRPAALPAPPRIQTLPPELREAIGNFYVALGGEASAPRARPGSWDLAFEHGLVVELDEELHFNRYRALSLTEEWAASLPWRSAYLQFGQERESECLAAGKWGKRWTNTSCEAMFGPVDPPGIFGTGGPTRWKQRPR